MSDIKPTVDGAGVPWCDEECPSFDGKRCRQTGNRPDAICEPAVQRMAADVKRLRKRSRSDMATRQFVAQFKP